MPVPADPRGLRAPRVWGPGAGGPGEPAGHQRLGRGWPVLATHRLAGPGKGKELGARGGRSRAAGAAGGAGAGAGGEEFGRLCPGCGPGARPGPCGRTVHSTLRALVGGGGLQHPFPFLGPASTLARSPGLGARPVGVAHPKPDGLLHLPRAVCPGGPLMLEKGASVPASIKWVNS